MKRALVFLAPVLLALAACNVILGLDELHDRAPALDASGDGTVPADGATDAAEDATSPPDAMGGDADATADAKPDAADATGPTTCTAYCALMLQKCTGSAAQYVDGPTCLAICDAFPEAGATAFSCRATQAAAIGANPSVECSKAGPYSFGACGTERAAFCELFFWTCATNGYSATCPEFDNLADPTPGAFVLDGGTARDCRETNLEQAFAAVVGACNRAGAAPTAACP